MAIQTERPVATTEQQVVVRTLEIEVAPDLRLGQPSSRSWFLPFPLEIDVTEADIQAGRRGEVDACPIALAMARAVAFNGAAGHEPFNWSVPVPRSVHQWIKDFDAGRAVPPMRFRIEPRDDDPRAR